MADSGRRRRGEPWVSPGDGADHITALPLELRARIAASLPFRQVARLATLSRPWRHIHHHAPLVDLDLDQWCSAAGVLNDDALACLEVALARRGQDGSGSRVDTLRIAYDVDDPGMGRHGRLIIALADARRICVTAPRERRCPLEDWTVDLSPAARDLEVDAFCHLAPTVAGPGAAALQTLHLDTVVLRDWPSLPSLRSLTLQHVTVVAPFPTGARCPRLEQLRILKSIVELARVHIRLPLLTSLQMDGVYGTPRGCIAIDAPELEELGVSCAPGYAAADYHSFTLRAPRLRCLTWSERFAAAVHIDVGKPGTVTSGRIEFTWSRSFGYRRKMKDFRAQMMQMLQGLVPDLMPECVADAAR
ncbi:unnamed protein product [Urochloa humidicola]